VEIEPTIGKHLTSSPSRACNANEKFECIDV